MNTGNDIVFPVGTKVRVKSHIEDTESGPGFITEMKKYLGKIVTITAVITTPFGTRYTIAEDANTWSWANHFFDIELQEEPYEYEYW